MTMHTVCNHCTSILAEYGRPATIVADFGSKKKKLNAKKAAARYAVFYDRRAGSDKRSLSNREPKFVCNTLKNISQPGTLLNRPQPIESPGTYTVDIQGTIYQRTMEHLRPRSQSEVNVPPSAGSNLPRTLTPVQSSKGTHVPNVRAITSPQLAEGSPKGSVPTRDNAKISALPCSEKQADRKPVGAVVASERTGDQSKSKVQEQDASPCFQPSL
ncbi:unnamed protein product, partial [Porites lobata]